MIANVTIAHLSACRFLYSGDKRTRSREKIRLAMGTLKRLSEHWIMGKRTYREIGIVARELLSLSNDPPLDSGIAYVSPPDISSLEIPLFDMPPDAEFDFCAFFDSGIPGLPGMSELNSQFIVE